jgi:hypothetical protein
MAAATIAFNNVIRTTNQGIKDSNIGPNMSTPALLSIIGVALICVLGWLGILNAWTRKSGSCVGYFAQGDCDVIAG